MNELSFKSWLMQELVDPGEPSERPMDMAAMMARAGGGPGAFATGTAPKRPWESGITAPKPVVPKLNNGWAGADRQIARRIKPITPKGSMMAQPPALG